MKAKRFAWMTAPLLAGIFALAALPAAQADDSVAAPATLPAPAKKKISGVELYAIHCNRCHPERYPVEFDQRQWPTYMLHMRVRANLPAEQAREILKYLQEEAGY